MNRCPEVLTSGPRVGQVCGRIFRKPHRACEKHRPAPPRRVRVLTPEENRRHRERAKRRAATAGLSPAMEAA